MASKRFPALLAASLLCLVPAACGSDDGASDGGSDEPTAVTFEATEPSKGKLVLDGPKTVPAGLTEITLKNSGKGLHDAQIYRVEGDRTADQVLASVIDPSGEAPLPDWIVGGGGVGGVAPGESATVTEVLEPGTHYVLDSAQGGIAKLEVTGEPTTAALPETEAKIAARDYSFETAGIAPGANRVRFENIGKQPHHVVAMPLVEGATIDDAKKFLTSKGKPQGPPPVDFENGLSTAVIDGGQAQVAELEFQKGKYALVCFIVNRGGGPPHVSMGMLEEVDVK
jgi:plastocyanin